MTAIRKIAAALLAIFTGAQPAPAPAAPIALPGLEFHDRRRFAAQSHHGYKVRRRKLSLVTGICLHQTACVMGERPARFDGGGAHFFVTRAGRVIWLHGFDRRVAAANGWNAGTISIEIDGRYPLRAGGRVWNDPSTPHVEQPTPLTPESVTAALQLIEWIRAQVPGIRVIVAHRQSSATRPDDPGEEIWKAVAVPSGLVMAPDTTLDDGQPLPDYWIA